MFWLPVNRFTLLFAGLLITGLGGFLGHYLLFVDSEIPDRNTLLILDTVMTLVGLGCVFGSFLLARRGYRWFE
ncbi:hypothetical protein [Streptomyces litchfieldiae]|uniref:Uncharacterized protein n=1 Tax=Streptomyces litchfieldiae TaxID=3075543 RepID=A0ABU2MZ43_9ACTN|nr:hypothetical protein [Streptomyces sp. DSM 44938]MDT0346931.1 hypothetical protein [Streptomyces sp. DSM 44938]